MFWKPWKGYDSDSDDDCLIHDNCPEHIDPFTGNYKPGVRKCSHCKEFKFKKDYTKEEAARPAARRVCNVCLAKNPELTKKKSKAKSAGTKATAAKKTPKISTPLPSIETMKIKEMKLELQAYGVSLDALLEKCEIVEALLEAREERMTTSAKLTVDIIKSFKVAELKEELKARGGKVSGVKGVLQQRLAETVGLPWEGANSQPKAKKEAPKKERARKSSEPRVENKENVPFRSNLNVNAKVFVPSKFSSLNELD